MATRAIFVGVNKHRDLTIPELGGARRDATALWALFTDTIEGLSAHLLVDERATHADVSGAILGALDSAQEDDVVMVGFAGHGSPDGSLVLFDTDAADLAHTALPMAALAEAFKRTKARAVLCILDCCFSGQAASAGPRNKGPPTECLRLGGGLRRGDQPCCAIDGKTTPFAFQRKIQQFQKA